jgi:SAM-dependent MidA family methyltransferase
MERALYGPDGFFVRPDTGPGAHFRTSVHASPLFAGALARLLVQVDEALGRPDPLDLVDVGAGRGELLTALLAAVPPEVAARLNTVAVELAPRPDHLPAAISWTSDLPPTGTGLLVATEWLDNVPLDVVEDGRYVLVDEAGNERPGPPVEPDDAAWLARWWPVDGRPPGSRAEVGVPRDAAWAAAVGSLTRGVAVTVDFGHFRHARPAFGTLTGFRGGRQVAPVPDGGCDLTAHVAWDSLAAAGAAASGVLPTVLTQRAALHALGVDGARPALALAGRDPGGYVRALAAASAAAELTEPAGLGGHLWLIQPVGMARTPASDSG